MRYRRSEELKESGIEWIGKIPEGWELKRLKFLSEVNSSNVDKKSNENESDVELCNYTDVYYNEFITEQLEFMKATASNTNIKRFQLQEGDVIITKDSESQDDMAVPALVKSTKENLICGYHLALVRSNQNLLSGDYLFRLFQSKKYREEFGIRSNGITRYGLGVYEIKNISIYVPPRPEQRSIAAFLDRKTKAIDQLIEKKEQLIERLNEKRQALITQAVTKGLDPDVPMKDSGIMWLEKIPEHWEVYQLRRVVEKFVDYRGSTPNKIDSGIPLITAANIDDEKIDFSDVEVYISEEEYEERMVRGFPKKGDVLVTTEAPLGEVAQIEEDKVALAQRIILFKTRENLSDDFLLYYLLSGCGQSELKSRATGSTALGIKGSKLKGIDIIVPPLQEQRKIAEFVNSESKKVFVSISKLNKQIEKLKEYRQALISAAVTGKIDVRSTYAEASSAETGSEGMASVDGNEVEAEEDKQKTKTANIHFKRRVLAAKILDDLHAEPTMGRRKLQKILYLLEKEIEAIELKGKYHKDAAGPFDNRMMRSIESQLEKAEWFKQVERENGYGYKYVPMIKKDEYKKYYNKYWGDIDSDIKELLELLRTEKTDLLSLVATLYACWNDFLLKDEEFNGKKLIHESRYNWHEEKEDIPNSDWADALNWMVDNGLEPEGVGELTREKD